MTVITITTVGFLEVHPLGPAGRLFTMTLALGGVFGAALRLFGWYRESLIKTPFYDHDIVSQAVSIVFFVGLCLYLWFDSTRKVKET